MIYSKQFSRLFKVPGYVPFAVHVYMSSFLLYALLSGMNSTVDSYFETILKLIITKMRAQFRSWK